jgi:hypothetical protein
MLTVLQKASITVDPEGKPLGEVVMVGQERWQEIHRLFREGRVPNLRRSIPRGRQGCESQAGWTAEQRQSRPPRR